jgi:hypothetical protein
MNRINWSFFGISDREHRPVSTYELTKPKDLWTQRISKLCVRIPYRASLPDLHLVGLAAGSLTAVSR